MRGQFRGEPQFRTVDGCSTWRCSVAGFLSAGYPYEAHEPEMVVAAWNWTIGEKEFLYLPDNYDSTRSQDGVRIYEPREWSSRSAARGAVVMDLIPESEKLRKGIMDRRTRLDIMERMRGTEQPKPSSKSRS